MNNWEHNQWHHILDSQNHQCEGVIPESFVLIGEILRAHEANQVASDLDSSDFLIDEQWRHHYRGNIID